MPKSKSRKRRKPASGGGLDFAPPYSVSRRRRERAIIAAVAVAAAVGAAGWWWWSAAAETEFLALADTGKAALSKVRTVPSRGGGHLRPGQTTSYPSRFPTSGIHHANPAEPGFHDAALAATRLVHAAEHGHVVIYYDRPGATARATLRGWAGLYTGRWDGIVITPMAGLGERVVLTAWTRRLDLARFDAAAAAAFIDSYRGRGPEHPVR